jgi:hypothetical protein
MKQYFASLLFFGVSICAYAQGTFQYAAALNGQNVVPANNSSATGTAEFTLNGSTLQYFFNWHSTEGITGIHIHGPATTQENASSLFSPQGTPGTWPPNGFLFGSIDIAGAQVADLNNGLWYLDFHTAGFPDGAIRGQILPVPEPSTMALFAVAGLITYCRFRRVI